MLSILERNPTTKSEFQMCQNGIPVTHGGIDTKWKLLNELKPSGADLKQIHVYNMQLGSDHGILLYPENGLDPMDSKDNRRSVLLQDYSHTSSLSFIGPFNEDGYLKPMEKWERLMFQKQLLN